MTREHLDTLLKRQLDQWPELAERVAQLAQQRRRVVALPDGREAVIVNNPARRRSSGADLSAEAIAARRCFLCADARPGEQLVLDRFGGYELLANPYPAGWPHLTIVAERHEPQAIRGRERELTSWIHRLEGMVVFYNGAGCGASCPDHLHFQAIDPDAVPLFAAEGAPLGAGISRIVASSPTQSASQLARLLSGFDGEPAVNILGRWDAQLQQMTIYVAARSKLRPARYSADPADPAGCMISPASLEMAGCIIAPLAKDFESLTPEGVQEILTEVAAEMPAPRLRIGITSAQELRYELNGDFSRTDLPRGNVIFSPQSPEATFTLPEVTIGVNFHWERRESQRFAGSLELVRCADGLTTAVNIIDIESYLQSVVSSEMSPHAELQFLMAHAVISRSWVMAQLAREPRVEAVGGRAEGDEVIRWYDRDDHTLFDFCADDHCQRYQGLGRQVAARAEEAVRLTRGQVLVDQHGRVCDARFSKCCGGAMELFSTCWDDDVDHPYLQARLDRPGTTAADFSAESAARAWIEGSPDAFCNTVAPEVLRQVLNDYDRETPDYYRWTERYPAQELAQLIARKSGIDFGEILALEPLQRGPSGRIMRLRIVGSRRAVTVGKELEIRRWLSPSHLKSSAFVVERSADGAEFILRGAGWGHGVGLCQIGAANMSAKGYDYKQILSHYYPTSHVERRY